MRPFSLMAVLLLLPPASVRGQDALFSALSLDDILKAKPQSAFDLSPDRPHLGSVQLLVGTYFSASYNDNINSSEFNPQSDEILGSGVTLGFVWPATDQSEIRFGTGIGYIRYLRYTSNSGLNITPDSALSYAISFEDGSITAFDQFSYSREVTQGALANVTVLPVLDNTIGLRTEWNPNKWVFQLGYSHNDYLSDAAAYDYLNRSSEYFFTRAAWRFAEATQAGVEASGGLTKYWSASQGNSQNASVGGYLEWQLRPALHLTLRGGPTWYFFDANGTGGQSSTLNAYYVSLIFTHQLTDYVSQTLNVEREVQLGLNQGSAYIEQLTTTYSVNFALTQRISLGASITYENGRQPLPVSSGPFIFQTTEDFTRFGGGPQLSWRFTDKLTGNLNYSIWQRDSNLAGRGYTENIISLGASYTF